MYNLIKKNNLNQIYQYLLIVLAFLAPLTVFGANLVIVVICLIWLLSGEYKSKYNKIISNPLMLASIIFFSLHVLGLFWSEDLEWGLHIVHKMWYFLLLLPLLYTLTQRNYIKYYIISFLMAIIFTEIISYLIWFGFIPPFYKATLWDPTPFMSHISYNPILCIAIYIVCHQILFNLKLSQLTRYFYSFLSVTMIINMFITGGRAGHIMFFAMLGILFIQSLISKQYKAVFLIAILIPCVFFTAYQASDTFNTRVKDTVTSIKMYAPNSATALGHRITYGLNTIKLIKKNLIFGVG